MAFRGRGRGRGPGRGGGFGSGHCRQEEFVLFPDVELPDINSVVKDRALVAWNCRLESFWQSSPYHLKVTVSKEIQETDIERFSDRGKQKSTKNSGSIAEYMKFNKNNFPLELFYGRSQLKKPKKVRWNPDSDLQKLDFLENLEQKHQQLILDRARRARAERKRMKTIMRMKMKMQWQRTRSSVMMAIIIRTSILMMMKMIITWQMTMMMKESINCCGEPSFSVLSQSALWQEWECPSFLYVDDLGNGVDCKWSAVSYFLAFFFFFQFSKKNLRLT
ncbi:uncharacterized protein LOC131164345 isoform X2 [Malania oleifera]|uniref:uncharacterized protein LOC131164345 isoform X2 n=1 Tax=Malania oleifera TaxID=397392 RepID=UPI0025AE374B|nr:uncharacterized protein LOC131164345 isoform X2 [Malania oleifera]XP_057977448.1 uncharacterized protein LOC131164345 isoform X2 [Malania oleifera]